MHWFRPNKIKSAKTKLSPSGFEPATSALRAHTATAALLGSTVDTAPLEYLLCVRACGETTIIGRALFVENRRKMILARGAPRPPRPGGNCSGNYFQQFWPVIGPLGHPRKKFFRSECVPFF